MPISHQSHCLTLRSSRCRIFVQRCNRCGEGIYPKDLVMRSQTNVYHIDCFTCVICQTTLSQGDLYGIRNNLVYCRLHYEMYPGVNAALTGLGGSVNHLADCFLSSENAIHPVSDQYAPPNDPITGVPAYGSTIYGSPGNGLINSHSSLSHVHPGIGPGASIGAGVVASGTPAAAAAIGVGGNGGGSSNNGGGNGTGVRKGRPRKRKTNVNGPDAQSAGSCSIHDAAQNEPGTGHAPQTLSGEFL
ncbi:apterous-2-like protein [Dinothrombium tinctorium]|uniref:Apterous-2-like protein n=1 Tax=Dinothrombium tinctorium TaxID=1965070 RepID=A0A3S3PMS9_9ACAR|nr:apterous-2-like protein [Dinothrombium tinctorium]